MQLQPLIHKEMLHQAMHQHRLQRQMQHQLQIQMQHQRLLQLVLMIAINHQTMKKL